MEIIFNPNATSISFVYQNTEITPKIEKMLPNI